MRLFFDQNLSPELVGLGCARDDEVWEYARLNDLAIVTKDDDFNNLSVLRGFPPKVDWLQLGNCTTDDVEAVLRTRIADIKDFEQDDSAGTLVLN